MTPEQIDRVMQLVRDYGLNLMFYGLHGDRRYLETALYEQIEAALKGESDDAV